MPRGLTGHLAYPKIYYKTWLMRQRLPCLLALAMACYGRLFIYHYPVTLTTYDYEGNEIETTYEKAPQRVLCVYQGTIETMIALGLEDRVTACYGLDNPVNFPPSWATISPPSWEAP